MTSHILPKSKSSPALKQSALFEGSGLEIYEKKCLVLPSIYKALYCTNQPELYIFVDVKIRWGDCKCPKGKETW